MRERSLPHVRQYCTHVTDRGSAAGAVGEMESEAREEDSLIWMTFPEQKREREVFSRSLVIGSWGVLGTLRA